MEKKKTKKKEPQVIEIHIYVHQSPNFTVTTIPNGGAGGTGDYKPPYQFIC